MVSLFLGLTVANVVGLVAALVLGYVARGDEGWRGYHLLAGVLAALLCIGVHCMAFTYFIVTAKWVRHAVEVIEAEPEEVAQFAPIERFVRDAAAGGERLTLEQFAHRLAASPWWYVKWAAQRVRMSVAPKTRELRLEVFDSDDTGEPGRSRGLDGWEVRLTHAGRQANARVENAAAVLKLPEHVDARSFGLQVRDSAGREWVELFGRRV